MLGHFGEPRTVRLHAARQLTATQDAPRHCVVLAATLNYWSAEPSLGNAKRQGLEEGILPMTDRSNHRGISSDFGWSKKPSVISANQTPSYQYGRLCR